MDKTYHPTEIEEKWAKIWSERKLTNVNSDESFSQVIPPPNVTGTLHMGHSSVTYTHQTLPTIYSV